MDLERCKVYALLKGDELTAAAVVEPIRTAQLATKSSDPTDPAPCILSPAEHQASIGIARIWVSPKHRRKGLAFKLLDAVRSTAARPINVSRRVMAFSQPTTEGFALASAYQGSLFPNALCLVYRSM